MTWNLISLFLLCPLFWTSKFQGFSTILSTALTLHYCKNAVIYIYIPTSELVFIQDWQILSKCLRKKPKFGFYWQIKPTRFLYQKKIDKKMSSLPGIVVKGTPWQLMSCTSQSCFLNEDEEYICLGEWNIWVFSPLVASKREKNILVLLSLYIFEGTM